MITKEKIITLIKDFYRKDYIKKEFQNLSNYSEFYYKSDNEYRLANNLKELLDYLFDYTKINLIKGKTDFGDSMYILTADIEFAKNKKYSIILRPNFKLPINLDAVIDLILNCSKEMDLIKRH